MPDETLASNPLSLHNVLELFAQGNKDAEIMRTEVGAAEKSLGTSVDTEVEAIIRDGQLSSQIKSAQDQLLLSRARRNQEAAAFFGVNQEAANSIIAEMAASIQDQHKTLKESARGIQARQQRPFADDPLNWIYDQFALPSDIAAHNTGVQIMDADMQVLDKLGTLADKQIARNNAIDVNTNAAISAMEAEKFLTSARVRAENARQKAMQLGVQFGTIRTALSQQAFSNMLQLHSAQVAVQHLELSKSTRALQETQTELHKKQLELLIKEKEEKLESKHALQGYLDKATSILGLRRLTPDDFDRAPANIKAMLWDVMANPSVREGRLGYDTLDSLQTAEGLNAPLTPGTNDVKNILQNWADEARTKSEWAGLKKEEKHSKVNTFITDRLKSEANNIPDGAGLYSAPSITAVDKIPAVKATKLWTDTFAPQAAVRQNAPLSAQAVYDAAVDAITQNRMGLDQAAAEVSLIYKSIAVDNSQQRDYNRFALPMQDSYKTSINTGVFRGILGNHNIVDMTSSAQITRQLTRTMAQQKVNSGGNPLLNIPGVFPLGEDMPGKK